MNVEKTEIQIEETKRSLRCKEIRRTIQGVWRLWLRHPDMTLGQLMLNFCALTDKEIRDRIQKEENKE